MSADLHPNVLSPHVGGPEEEARRPRIFAPGTTFTPGCWHLLVVEP